MKKEEIYSFCSICRKSFGIVCFPKELIGMPILCLECIGRDNSHWR